MATPCIVAVGTRDAWRGVPCKMDGYESWSGAFLVDRIVRDGAAAAAEALVTSVKHGWDCVGNMQLTEPDEFLGGDAITHAIERDVLGRHHAVYVIDVEAVRLEVYACVDGDYRWLEPAELASDRAIRLPSWYPQLGARSFAKRRRPEAVTRELQEQCRSLGIAWGSVCEALRRWVTAQLGDLTGCAWLYLGGTSDDHVRCLIDETFLYASTNSSDCCFTGADGRMRNVDIDDVDLAERMFGELEVRPSRTRSVLQKWLTLAARHGADDPLLGAQWFAGSKRWNIERHRLIGGAPMYLPSVGCLPTLLCWLF